MSKVLQYFLGLIFASLFIQGCDLDNTTTKHSVEPDRLGRVEMFNIPTCIPRPNSFATSGETIRLSSESKIYTPNESLSPLIEILAEDIKRIHGISLDITTQNDKYADLTIEIDKDLQPDEYQLIANDEISIFGGSYQACAMATASLKQLMKVEEGQLAIQDLQMENRPEVAYRGLMIDLARQWHELSTIKQLIDMAAYYQINYVQLHFTDYQSYTLPSRHYPKLSTPDRHYSFEELAELEEYSQLRGVTIIPELEVPGHAGKFVETYPEIFALQDTVNNPWTINMGKEEVYEAIDKLVDELAETFKATPYIHMGGDEAIFTSLMKDPHVKEYIKTQDIKNDPHELYRHFLVRINDIVKKHGKKMCIWEGFRPEGEIKVPKDLIVFEFETNRYLPNELLDDGYTVVNTSWKPIYVVNKKKWEPKTIYEWNIGRWENWYPKAPSIVPIQVEPNDLLIGAQMCAWEQSDEAEVPSIRKRLAAFSAVAWSGSAREDYEVFLKNLETTDQILSKLISDDRQDSLLVGHNFNKDME